MYPFVTEAVVVMRPSESFGADGERSVEWSDEPVAGVLVAPGRTSDVDAAGRPSGTECDATLHFPKTFGSSLRNCKVLVRGLVYAVVGDPIPYTAENVPGEWWMPVGVKRVEG